VDYKSLSDQQLQDLIVKAGQEAKNRSPRGVQLEEIKPGMKPEDLARARQEIAEVLKEGGY
jgi:hypothetical protein